MKELANAHGPSCIAPVDFIYGLSHHHHHLIESDASTPDTIDDKKTVWAPNHLWVAISIDPPQ